MISTAKFRFRRLFFRKFFQKNFKEFQEYFKEKSGKKRILIKNKKEKPRKTGGKRLIWYVFDSSLRRIGFIFKNEQKILKKFKKVLKKVLTNENIYDILHERSTEERKKQRSLKIEQQQIRTN